INLVTPYGAFVTHTRDWLAIPTIHAVYGWPLIGSSPYPNWKRPYGFT
ncbi:MAG: hypothetical protein GY943_16050, partial [Chloroflexi bacterium]|nr:hypothetical protein [Chloroflexota bacterium]